MTDPCVWVVDDVCRPVLTVPRTRVTGVSVGVWARERVTLLDVVSGAGVSPSTASRVLHGGAGVGCPFAARVASTAQSLGCAVNHNARSLRRGRDQAIGLVVEDLATSFLGRTTAQLERSDREQGHGLTNACPAPAPPSGWRCSRCCRGTSPGSSWAAAPASRPPASAATSASASRWSSSTPPRPAPWLAREELVVHGGFSTAPGRAAVREALARQPEVTAVFSSGSRTSPGALSAMANLGRRHTACTGLDDVDGAGAFVPALTVVEQDVEARGREAVRLLFDRIADRSAPPRHVEVPRTSFARGSSVPVRARPCPSVPVRRSSRRVTVAGPLT